MMKVINRKGEETSSEHRIVHIMPSVQFVFHWLKCLQNIIEPLFQCLKELFWIILFATSNRMERKLVENIFIWLHVYIQEIVYVHFVHAYAGPVAHKGIFSCRIVI